MVADSASSQPYSSCPDRPPGVGSSANDGVGINAETGATGGQAHLVSPGAVITDKMRVDMEVITNTVGQIRYINTDNNTTGTNRTDIRINGYTCQMRVT